MAISDAIIRMAKYPPELLPDAWQGAVPLLAEVAPPVLDLRRFSPHLLALTDIEVTPLANVLMRVRYDDIRLEELTVAMPLAVATPMPGAWFLPAKQYLYLNLTRTAAPALPNYPIFYSVWAQMPSIAHKLVHSISLSSEEQAIADKFNVANSVEKGVLPIPLSQQIEREYYVLGEETKSRAIALAVANTDYSIENIYTRANEFIVLTRIAALPGILPAQNLQIIVDRDDDHNYVTMPTFPLNVILGGEVSCFIPAMSEIRLHALFTAGAPIATAFRYTIKRIRLTNILRARFGLVSRDQIPGDTYDKVVAGIV